MKKNLLLSSCITVFICYILGSTFYVVFDQTSFLVQLTLKVIGALVTFITIILFQYKSSKSYRKSIMLLFSIGFAFVLFGDYFLAYANKDVSTKEVFFPFGMAAYLVGYSLFGISFFRLSQVKINLKMISVFIVVTIPTMIFYLFLDIPGELKIPLFAYSMMMILLLSSGVFLFNKRPMRLFGIAAILYYISDIIVGLNEFSSIRSLVLLEFFLFIPYVAGHIFMIIGIYKYTWK